METVANILQKADLTGFTELIKGDRIERYVVAFTHNHFRSLEELQGQIERYSQSYDNITLGGRTDRHGEVVVDIGTSTDCFDEALRLKRLYYQICIWDSVAGREY